MNRTLALSIALCLTVSAVPLAGMAAPKAVTWSVPHNSFGQPDLSGNWTNVSMTAETRPAALTGPVYTQEQAAKIEGAADKFAADANKPSDPNAPAPTAGGDKVVAGTRAEFAGAGGAVGGYDYGWLDPGTRIMRVNGQPRTSILTTPDGKAPKAAGRTGPDIPADYRHYQNRFDNPEWMSMGERCIMGFGRNAGPPMLANGFYNNDYQIIQTPTEVDIVIEMVHDVRQIRLDSTHRTDGVRPLMGDSIGRYEGNTLVVETTNIPEVQAYHGAWKDMTVTERFTPVGPGRLDYQFTIHAPSTWAADWGGEYEFHPLKGQLYEYACAEGNYALEHMLAGARAEETRGQKKGS